MVVVDAYAVHYHAAMMVIFHAAAVTSRAVVHTGQFVGITLVAETHFSVVFHFVVNYAVWREIVVED